jgi:hypothetical protein
MSAKIRRLIIFPGGVEVQHVDVLRPSGVGHVETALVGGEGEAVRILEVGHEAGDAVGITR